MVEIKGAEQGTSPKEILAQAIKETHDLDLRARIASSKEEFDERRDMLVERAQLVVDLPEKISQALGSGKSFPDEELVNLYSLASMAKDAIENDMTTFMLGSLLTDMGAKKGDPNYLEEIYQRVYRTIPKNA